MKSGLLRDPKIYIGVLVSTLFVWLALKGIDPQQFLRAFREADYRFLPPAVALSICVVWIRSMRWRVLMRGLKPVRTYSLFKATTIGFTVNYMVPIRLGELVRAYLAGTMEGVNRSAAFATVVVERLLDVFSILLVFVGVLFFVEFPQGSAGLEGAMKSTAMAVLIIGLVGAGCLWAMRRRTEWFVSLVQATLGKISKRLADRLCGLMIPFAEGVTPFRQPADALEFGLYTVLLWALTVVVIVLLAEAFHLGVPWEASLVIVVAIAFGVSLPSAPGFVGTFHYAAFAGLLIYGVPRSEALSYAIVLHATSILPIFFLGVIFLWFAGLRLGSLTRLRREEMDSSQ